MRAVLVWFVIAVFVALGVCDLAAGSWRTGIASVCLGAANFLLLGVS